jgi:hypothetical protein
MVEPLPMEGFVRDALNLRAIFIVSLVSLFNGSCDPCDSSLDPVKCSDLCEQPRPHADCAKCTSSASRAVECPQCDLPNPMPGCPNYVAPADGGANDASIDVPMDGDVLSGGNGGVGGNTGGMGGMGVTGGMDGDSGTAGDAGVVGVVCETAENCSEEQAVCGEDKRCGPCTHSDECALHAGALVCDIRPNLDTTGRCVDCLSDGECSSANAPECVLGFCVECETHAECESNETPQCSGSYACEKCENDDACASGHGARTICDDRGTSVNHGACVECETHRDCGDEAKPQCDATGTCVPCTHDGACTGRTDGDIAIGRCNTRADATTFGRCVQCTGAAETACGSNACRQDDGRCTGTVRGSVQPCGTCQADSECDDGMDCIEVSLGGAAAAKFCLWTRVENGGCANTGIAVRPFSIAAEHTSIDGNTEDYCLPPTTCQAYLDAAQSVACLIDNGCGIGDFVDGRCPTEGSAQYNCSYNCDFDYECPDNLPNCDGFCQP